MFPLRNAIPCRYYRLKQGVKLPDTSDFSLYEDPVFFHGVLGDVDGGEKTSGYMMGKDYSYSIETNDLKLWSRKIKPNDMIIVGDKDDDDMRFQVVSVKIGVPRVNFRDQKRNEEEAPKRLFVK